jgi:hypothetical protein
VASDITYDTVVEKARSAYHADEEESKRAVTLLSRLQRVVYILQVLLWDTCLTRHEWSPWYRSKT